MNKTRYYCTHFDINYISHAKSLYYSLELLGSPFKLFMFCMCDESYNHLEKLELKNVQLVHYNVLEKFNPRLLVAKANRSKVEYFYTCSPAVCFYTLSIFKEVDLITYLDADLYFFSSPEPIFKELGDKSIGIIAHRFGWLSKRNKVYGIYNVGWINFRNDEEGISCLTEWMNDCISWCYQRLEDGKYADQKYLDLWPSKYNNLHVIQHKGANLGPWNISNYKISKKGNEIFVDRDILIFYHFANLKQMSEYVFKTDLSRAFVRTSGTIREYIYIPYIRKLLSNKDKNIKIYAKKDTHISGIYARVVNLTRNIRTKIFPDLIDVG